MKKVLVISNGQAEDLVADEIIRSLGQNYETIKLPLVDTTLPSGGFSLRNLRFLWQDISQGLIGKTIKNIITLRQLRGKIDLTIAIGDIVPILAARMVKAPFVFVGVNKSSYYKTFGYNYTPWEKFLLKKYALKTYVRDEETLKDLSFAEYVGNPLMDISPSPSACPDERSDIGRRGGQGVRVIGFLPGTRRDAKLNLEDFAKIAKELLKLKDPSTDLELLTATQEKEVPNYFINKPFAEVLSQANIIIGLSGTGNEQAVGCGIPVISFPGRGSQYNKKFAKAQKELLGEALLLLEQSDPQLVAGKTCQLLNSPEKMLAMSAAGRQRMGVAGAIEKIAQFISSQVK